METLHDGETTSFANGSESRQDVPVFAPDVLEVLTLELGALIDNQVFGPCSLSEHDSIQGCGHFLGRGPALEHGQSHGSPRIMIDHVQ